MPSYARRHGLELLVIVVDQKSFGGHNPAPTPMRYSKVFGIYEIAVEFVSLGEGYNGEYDPDDPMDEKLVRFEFHRKQRDWEGGEWKPVLDSSYCSEVTDDDSKHDGDYHKLLAELWQAGALEAAMGTYDEAEDAFRPRNRKIFAELSHTDWNGVPEPKPKPAEPEGNFTYRDATFDTNYS